MNTETIDHSAQGRTFTVVGATAQQGGATARSLLAAGAGVRALTRNPHSESAQVLTRQGAQPKYADLEDAENLREAFSGVDGVFAMTTFATERGTEGEVEDGKMIAEAARDAGVPHMVYSSVGGAERHTGIPHFESKRRVEEYMESLGLPATFVRPAFFMDNFESIFTPSVENGALALRMPLPAGVPLQMIAADDIGKVAAAALLDPSRVDGGQVEIAGDEFTGDQVAAIYGEREGGPRATSLSRWKSWPTTPTSRPCSPGSPTRPPTGRTSPPQGTSRPRCRTSPPGWPIEAERERHRPEPQRPGARDERDRSFG